MKLCILHRYPEAQIKSTNAAFPYFVEELRKRGHTVDVRTFRYFDRMRKGWKSFLWIFYSPLLVLGEGYDLIYCDDSFPFYALLVHWASPKSKIYKRMGDLHLMYYFSGWSYKLLHWIERWEWRAMDLLIPVSNEMANYICEDMCWEWYNPKTEIVFDPIDLDDFPYSHADGKEPFDVMFHGTLTKHKGIEMLVEAAKRLPEVTFCIVGDGPERKNLKSTANFYLHSWVSYKEIASLLRLAKIGVAMRSKNRGNEYVITQPVLQYSAVGRPLCASRRKCLSEPCFGDIDELVEQIEVLLRGSWDGKETGLELRNRMGLYNRKVMEDFHDARKIAVELADFCTHRWRRHTRKENENFRSSTDIR